MDEKLIRSIAKGARDSFQLGDDETTIRLCNSVIDKITLIQESTTSSKIPPPLFMLYIFKGMSLQRQALRCHSPLTDTERISAIKTCFNVAYTIFPKSPLSLKGLISLYENSSNPPVQEHVKAIDALLDIEYDEGLLEKLIPLLPVTSQRLKDILLKLCGGNSDDGVLLKNTTEQTSSRKYFKLLRDILMKEEIDSIEATVKKERYRLSAPPLDELRANVQRKHLESGSLLTSVLRICHSFKIDGETDGETDVFIRRIYSLIPCVTLISEKEILLKELHDLLLKCKPTPFTKAITLDLQDISDVNDLFVGPGGGVISGGSSCNETVTFTTSTTNTINGPTKMIMEICSTKHKSLADIRIAKEKLKEYQLNYMKQFPKRTAFLMYLEGRCLMAQRKFAEAIPLFETSIPVEDSMTCLLWSLQESNDGLDCLEDALAISYGRDRILRLLDCLKVTSKHHLIMKSYLSLSLEDLLIEGFASSELAHYYSLMYHHQKNSSNGGGGDHRYLLKALKEEMCNPSCLFLLSQHYKQASDYASQKRCLLKAFEVICSGSDSGGSGPGFEDEESSFRKGDLLPTFLNDMFEQKQRSDCKTKVKKLTIDICLSISELILLSKASISLEQAEMIYSFLLDLYENMDLSCFTVDFMNAFYLSTGRLGFYLLGFSTGTGNGDDYCISNSNSNGSSPLSTTTLSSEIDPMLVLSFLKRCPPTLENDLLVSKTFEMAGMPRASLKKLESIMIKYPFSKEAVLYYVSLRINSSFFDGLDDLSYLLALLNGLCIGNVDSDCNSDDEGDALSHYEQTVAADLIFQVKIIKATISLIDSFNDAAADLLTGNLKATNKHQHSMLSSYYTLLFLLGNRDVVQFLEQYSDEDISSYLLLKYFEDGEGDLSLIERIISSTTNNSNAGLTMGMALLIRGSETDIQKAEAVFKTLIHNRSSFTIVESLSLSALSLLFSKTYQSVKEQRVANILRDKQCTKFPFLNANQNNVSDIFYCGVMATGLRKEERDALGRHMTTADVDDFIKNNSIAQIQGLHGFMRRCHSDLPGTAIFNSWRKGLEKRLEATEATIEDLPPSLLEYLDSQSTLDFLLEPQTWQNFLFYFNAVDVDGKVDNSIVPDVKDTKDEEEQDQKPEEILKNWLKINMKAGVFGRFGICDKETLCLIKTCFIDCIPSNLQQYLL